METNFSAFESRKNIDLFAKNFFFFFRYDDIHLTTSYINQDSPRTMSILAELSRQPMKLLALLNKEKAAQQCA